MKNHVWVVEARRLDGRWTAFALRNTRLEARVFKLERIYPENFRIRKYVPA
ncbi:hypothetical protein SAMN05428937_3735 [Achromobacter sp. MFA1 R4]|nr:hypothetical protein SAMN05428937_0012 [Achromobacter sp. MFA1 R4]SIT27914.1 hypothetical protein SAMN05428937_3735 [Achromobacter sp. MFA1 R4]